MSKDYYKTLGVARNATKDEVKKAYRSLAHKFHPDKGGDEKRFKEISEAYQILSDERRRAQYDQFGQVFDGGGEPRAGSAGFGWPGGFHFDFGEDVEGKGFADFDLSDAMDDFFGGGQRRRKHASERGRDIRAGIAVSFEESVLGAKKEMDVTRLVRCSRCSGSGAEPGTSTRTCPACQGTGHVQKTQRTFLGSMTSVATCRECRGEGKIPEHPCGECRGGGVTEKHETLEVFIPRGIRDGEVLKITGKGDAVAGGRAPGDLYIEIRVLPHPAFRRQGDDIVIPLQIKISQAVLGDTVELKTIDGAIRLKIPEGTQSGDLLSVRGKGAWRASGYGRGDLLIQIKVETPKGLARKARDLIRQLAQEGM
ncbi:MAG: molecular chaperone DnaJ [Patescibacteria group bacterium]